MGNSADQQIPLAGPLWLLEDTFVMFKFRLLAGTHIDEDGKEHKAGDIVYSSNDLAALFKEKFELVKETPLLRSSKLVTNPETEKPKAPVTGEGSAPSKPSAPADEDEDDEDDDEPEVKKSHKAGKSSK